MKEQRLTAWPRIVTAVTLAALLVGCSQTAERTPTAAPTTVAPTTAGARPATSAPDPATETAAQPDEPAGPRPERWVGIRDDGDAWSVVRVHGDVEEVVTRIAKTTEELPGAETVLTDVVRHGRAALLAVCCEPTSGQIYRATVRDGRPEQVDQGHRLDLGGESVFARTDTSGTLEILPAFPAWTGQVLRPGAAATDVAVEPPPGDRVVALVDPRRVAAFAPAAPARGERGLRLLERDGDGWEPRFIERSADSCAVVFLGGGRVGVLEGAFERRDPLSCSGRRMAVVDTGSGAVAAVINFPTDVRHVGVDAGGEHLIYTTSQGLVGWRTLDEDGGTLAPKGFVAADW